MLQAGAMSLDIELAGRKDQRVELRVGALNVNGKANKLTIAAIAFRSLAFPLFHGWTELFAQLIKLFAESIEQKGELIERKA
jgi:hypothetical protein